MNITKENNTSLYILVFVAAALLYTITCAPALVWQDSGMIQYRVLNNDIKGGLGLALAHPLYYIISIGFKFIPWLNFPLKINLVSPLAAAFVIANIFLFLKLLLKQSAPAIIGALSLALAHTFWRHATIPETYNLYTAFLVLELIMLHLFFECGNKKYIYALFFVNGLSIATHMFGILPLAGYILFAIYLLKEKKLNLKDIIIIAFTWLLGTSPYLYLIIEHFIQTRDLSGTISSALFGNSWKSDVLNAKFTTKILAQNVLFLGLNFPTPNIALAVIGLISLNKYVHRGFAGIIFALFAIFLAFASRYTVVDRYAFFIPFYCMTAIFIGIGSKWIMEKFKPLTAIMFMLALLTIPVYFAAPMIAKKTGYSLGTRNDIPYRDDYKWFLQPWRTGYTGADKYAQQILTTLKPSSVLIADGTTLYPLAITQQAKGVGQEIIIYASHGSYNTTDKYSAQFLTDKAKNKMLYSTRQNTARGFTIKNGLIWRKSVIVNSND